MNTGQSVLTAVATNTISTKTGVLQRLFAFWFDAFVYNQIWEDPRVDSAALNIDCDSRILTISSGGCNVLNYLIEDPESITAVDLNRYHIYLLRLKLTALGSVPGWEDFFNLFGRGTHSENLENYRRYIGHNLDDDTREFWQSNGMIGRLIDGKRINYFGNGGLYEHSRNGYFLRFFHRFAHILGLRPEKLLEAKSFEDQETIYREHIEPFFESRIIKAVGKMPATMFGLGIPPQQYDELKKELAAGNSVIDIYRERAKRLACGFPIEDNYFAWQGFARKYDTKDRAAIPDYLKESNFESLQRNVHRVGTAVGSITEQIRANPKGTFNRFVLLDAQDWMNSETISDLWSQIAHKAEPGSRIIFRTAGASSPIEGTLSNSILDRFEYQSERSAELFSQDRSSIYGGFHLYVFKG